MKTLVSDLVLSGTMLPPAPGLCQECAIDHPPEQPHDQQSIYWKYFFYKRTGGQSWPTWRDAMAHCAPEIQKFWVEALAELGVEVDEK